MLVSSIARFQAISSANNASFGAMTTANAMQSAAGKAGTFGNLDMLHALDNKFATDMANYSLLYKISMLQADAAKKLENENIKRTFSTFA